MMITTKVQKWGNSQGLRIDQQILAYAHLAIGDEVEVIAEADHITLRKAGRPRFDLAEMVSRIPADYQAEEVSFGPPVGREEW